MSRYDKAATYKEKQIWKYSWDLNNGHYEHIHYSDCYSYTLKNFFFKMTLQPNYQTIWIDNTCPWSECQSRLLFRSHQWNVNMSIIQIHLVKCIIGKFTFSTLCMKLKTSNKYILENTNTVDIKAMRHFDICKNTNSI